MKLEDLPNKVIDFAILTIIIGDNRGKLRGNCLFSPTNNTSDTFIMLERIAEIYKIRGINALWSDFLEAVNEQSKDSDAMTNLVFYPKETARAMCIAALKVFK